MIYFGLALFCTGLFLVKFMLSVFFGSLDTDLDVDGDGSVDFDVSGLFSFKGLLHFGIGFSWSMWFARGQENQLLASIIAIGVGILTSVILALAYWLAMKLRKEVIPEKGNDLVGKEVEIYYHDIESKEWIVFVSINDGMRKIPTTSSGDIEYKSGQKTKITNFQEGKYWIP